MLKSKKQTNMTNNTAKSPSVNILSEGSKVKGDLNSQSDIRIAGTIDGEATSKGKIIITGNGNIIGNVTSEDADIAGRVKGEVRVANKLSLRESAVIEGNIYTKTLVVEEGAQINGSCRMGAEAKSMSEDNSQSNKNISLKSAGE